MAHLEDLKNQLFELTRLNKVGISFYGGSEEVQRRISEVKKEIENFDGEEPEEFEDNRQEIEAERRSLCYSQGLSY